MENETLKESSPEVATMDSTQQHLAYLKKQITELRTENRKLKEAKNPEPAGGISEEAVKEIATGFFLHWLNSKAQEIDQGFDEYWAKNKMRYL